MVPPPRAAPTAAAHGGTSTGNDYGTMLQIRNVQMLPDGRSFVETWGTWRFRIMDRGMRDGYVVARVERIEDCDEELDDGAGAQGPPEPAPAPAPGSEPEPALNTSQSWPIILKNFRTRHLTIPLSQDTPS